MMDLRYDMVYEWTTGTEGQHDQEPVMLSEYLAALEEHLGNIGVDNARRSLGLGVVH